MYYNVDVIFQLLNTIFDDDAITIFCFDHYRFGYDNFFQGISRLAKIQRLINHIESQQAFAELLTQIKAEYPQQYAEFASLIKEQDYSHNFEEPDEGKSEIHQATIVAKQPATISTESDIGGSSQGKLILSALDVGPAFMTSTASNHQPKNLYHELLDQINIRFVDRVYEKTVLSEYKNDPETWGKPLLRALLAVGVDQDQRIIQLAQQLLALKLESSHQAHHFQQTINNYSEVKQQVNIEHINELTINPPD